jgi:hypothetical protein
MRSLVLLLIGSLMAIAATAQITCSELFFSEYIEGSSTNKCLEIYNPTSSTVSLDGYAVRMYFNGSSSAGLTITIPTSATIPPYGVYILCNNATFYPSANLVNTSGWYNGDDAVELVNDGVVIDRIGVVGVDPGTNWPVGTGSTVDRTLVRKANVGAGSLSWTGSGDQQWDVYPQDTDDYLGAHTSDCFVAGSCSITEISREDVVESCDDNDTASTSDDTYQTNISVSFENAPTTGNLVLEINGDIVGSVMASTLTGSDYTFSLVLPADGAAITATATFTDATACVFSENLGNNEAPCSFIEDCSELFFSEYIEGSSFNKCIEIFNPTNSDIDLAEYGVFLSFNGGTFENTIPLSGIIPAGGTYVVCNNAASIDFTSKADQLSGDLNFNGNDVVILENDGGVIDAIGQLGNATNYGIDVTLRRDYSITAGDNNPNDAFSTASEWIAYPNNTFWGLGYHANSCKPGLPDGLVPVTVGACNNGSVTAGSGSSIVISNACFGPALGDGVTMAFPDATLCGAQDISAQVSINSGFGKAGLMMRNTLSAGSPFAWIFTQGDNRVYFAYRTATNGTVIVNFKFALNVNYLRLTRNGNQFIGYVSGNGINWNPVFQVIVPLTNCVFAGPAVESNVSPNTTVATFNNINYGGPSLQGIAGNGLESNQDQANLTNELNVTPNPATSWVRIATASVLEGEGELIIRDLSGRVVLSRSLRLEEAITIDLPATMASGVYLVSLNTGDQVLTSRLVKQ